MHACVRPAADAQLPPSPTPALPQAQREGGELWELRLNLTCTGEQFTDAAWLQALVEAPEEGPVQVRRGCVLEQRDDGAWHKGWPGARASLPPAQRSLCTLAPHAAAPSTCPAPPLQLRPQANITSVLLELDPARQAQEPAPLTVDEGGALFGGAGGFGAGPGAPCGAGQYLHPDGYCTDCTRYGCADCRCSLGAPSGLTAPGGAASVRGQQPVAPPGGAGSAACAPPRLSHHAAASPPVLSPLQALPAGRPLGLLPGQPVLPGALPLGLLYEQQRRLPALRKQLPGLPRVPGRARLRQRLLQRVPGRAAPHAQRRLRRGECALGGCAGRGRGQGTAPH